MSVADTPLRTARARTADQTATWPRITLSASPVLTRSVSVRKELVPYLLIEHESHLSCNGAISWQTT